MIRPAVIAALLVGGLHADAAPVARASASPSCAGSFADGSVRVPATRFLMGSDMYYPEERPRVAVSVPTFGIDAHEVTNRQFAAFVAATGYVTEAERPGGGAFVFSPPPADQPFLAPDPATWWRFVRGATWRHPRGPGSDIAGHANDPVVDVTFADASAYARWAGRAADGRTVRGRRPDRDSRRGRRARASRGQLLARAFPDDQHRDRRLGRPRPSRVLPPQSDRHL
jgi:formylglycine-generating enzyme